MINLGKIISMLFWILVIAVYLVDFDSDMVPIIKIAGVVTLNIHILETFWFLSWKETGKLDNIPLHMLKVILFGAFHLKPLREKLDAA